MQKNNKTKKLKKFLSVIAMSAVLAGNVGTIPVAFATEGEDVYVHIIKYIGDEAATSESAYDSSFQMSATWNADNIGAGTGEYSLNSSNGYDESTTNMSSGADYSTNEIFDSTVAASCDTDAPFALVGYTTGDTLEEAEEGTPSETPPAFIDLTSDKYVIVWNEDCSAPEPDEFVSVQINKYIDEEQATAESADNADFTMSATWSSEDYGSGTDNYILSEDGYNDDPTPYQAETVEFMPGADYTTSEVMNGVAGASCEAETPFALVGYTYGDSLEEAESATPSLTQPAFTNLTSDKYVIVWNEDCANEEEDDGFVTVQINKYIDGEQADDDSADNASFLMNATWNAENIGAGTGQYNLDTSNDYETATADMTSGADYSTDEVMNDVVGASCEAETPFALTGYTSGNTLEEAEEATPSLTPPSFVDLMNDKYVIVWNDDCATEDEEGTIGGDVEGGDNGTLHVDSIDTLDSTATADGTFENGWKYVFHITAPSDEPKIAMKFDDWDNVDNASTIPVANNVRISSAQADNGNATVLITAANVYSTPDLNMITDLDAGTPGIQFEILVEAAVPSGSANGSYTTNYGVKSDN